MLLCQKMEHVGYFPRFCQIPLMHNIQQHLQLNSTLIKPIFVSPNILHNPLCFVFIFLTAQSIRSTSSKSLSSWMICSWYNIQTQLYSCTTLQETWFLCDPGFREWKCGWITFLKKEELRYIRVHVWIFRLMFAYLFLLVKKNQIKSFSFFVPT